MAVSVKWSPAPQNLCVIFGILPFLFPSSRSRSVAMVPAALRTKSGANSAERRHVHAAAPVAIHGDRMFIVDYSCAHSGLRSRRQIPRPHLDDARLPQRPAERPGHRPRRQPDRLRFALFTASAFIRPRARVRKFGGSRRHRPGQFGYVSDVVQDADGYYYVCRVRQNERITSSTADGKLRQMLGRKPAPNRASSAASGHWPSGPDGLLYVAELQSSHSGVHAGWRVRPRFGEAGRRARTIEISLRPGLRTERRAVRGRVRATTACRSSRPTASRSAIWGGPGREPGQLHNPWALAVDRKGRVHVVDTENNRVQRIQLLDGPRVAFAGAIMPRCRRCCEHHGRARLRWSSACSWSCVVVPAATPAGDRPRRSDYWVRRHCSFRDRRISTCRQSSDVDCGGLHVR